MDRLLYEHARATIGGVSGDDDLQIIWVEDKDNTFHV